MIMTELTTNQVKNMISERLAQAIVLTNHLQDGEPFEHYVDEKTTGWPSLDPPSKDIFHQISIILRSAYGVEVVPHLLRR